MLISPANVILTSPYKVGVALPYQERPDFIVHAHAALGTVAYDVCQGDVAKHGTGGTEQLHCS